MGNEIVKAEEPIEVLTGEVLSPREFELEQLRKRSQDIGIDGRYNYMRRQAAEFAKRYGQRFTAAKNEGDLYQDPQTGKWSRHGGECVICGSKDCPGALRPK